MGGLSDLVRVVNESATVNTAQLTGREDGSVIVGAYNWQDHFATYCTKVVGIKKLHHIRFNSAHPGQIFVKEKTGSQEEKRNIMKDPSWSPSREELPSVLLPSGLSLQRQWYLYEKIREFCPDELKDTTCPQPDQAVAPTPSTPPPPSSTTPPDTEPPPAKRTRLCGLCRQPGHNARSCPTK